MEKGPGTTCHSLQSHGNKSTKKKKHLIHRVHHSEAGVDQGVDAVARGVFDGELAANEVGEHPVLLDLAGQVGDVLEEGGVASLEGLHAFVI